MKLTTTRLAATLLAGLTGAALAAVTAEEAQMLATTHTPWGALIAGNKEGTIPAWTGPVKPPASYDAKNPGLRPDPFASEKPILSIDAKNLDQHAGKLSEGVKAMLKKYPSYRIDVYPSHRIANYPPFVIENMKKNAAGACKTTKNGLGIEGCYAGLPFPFPKTGKEVMWNRLLKYDTTAFYSADMAGRVVDTQGNVTVTGVGEMWAEYPIYDP